MFHQHDNFQFSDATIEEVEAEPNFKEAIRLLQQVLMCSQRSLAEKLDFKNVMSINNLCAGRSVLTMKTAYKLERLSKIPGEVWLTKYYKTFIKGEQ